MIPASGFVTHDHTIAAPLDHDDPGGRSIEIFLREVVAVDKQSEDLPCLVFLQGGPGSPGPRPTRTLSWLGRALETHRVFMLDQRGTGRSTPITSRSVSDMSPEAIADLVALHRADAIVRDCELARRSLLGDRKWSTLGQSYGGFITLCYLSLAPEGIEAAHITGGVPGLTADADEVYARTLPRVVRRNQEFYDRYPADVAIVRRIADRLASDDVRLADGDRLNVPRLQAMGMGLGFSGGFEQLHWLIETAWQGDELGDSFRHEVMATTGFVDRPLYALQEFCYAQGEGATGWAAQRAVAAYDGFASTASPLLFTGEMMFPWMFAEIAALRAFEPAAQLLAARPSWPMLYDAARLRSNEVPVAAAVYFDDLYVDSPLQLQTLEGVGNARAWVTNEYEHDGLRASEAVLGRLLDMTAGRV